MSMLAARRSMTSVTPVPVSEMPHRVERGATRSAASTRMGSHATETVARELGVTEGKMGRGKPPLDGREERGTLPGPWG